MTAESGASSASEYDRRGAMTDAPGPPSGPRWRCACGGWNPASETTTCRFRDCTGTRDGDNRPRSAASSPSPLAPLGAISRAVNEATGRALALGDPVLRDRPEVRAAAHESLRVIEGGAS